MSRRALLLSLAALSALAACNKGSSSASLRLAEPSSVAVARAFGTRHGGLWPYVAVANTARNELILIDAVEDRAVASPILLRPLSVPVVDPRPALVASAEFDNSTDPVGASTRPSLLVVASAGSTQLQLIRTWADPSAPDIGLAPDAPIDLGGQVLAMIAVQAVGADGPIPDHVRVVASLTDKRIAVVEFAWQGESGATGRPVLVGDGAVVEDLGFEALSLAVDPRDPRDLQTSRFLYAASLDDIEAGVQGVGQLDMSGPVGTWHASLRALDAGAPTRLVAALTVRERKADESGTYDHITYPDGGQDGFEADAAKVQRVYAWREPTSCGPETALPCGIVVLDTATRTLARPAFLGDQAPYPITVPSRPVALIAAPPSRHPPQGTQPPEDATFMLIQAQSARLTTGVLGIPCEDGRIYFADLARWEVPSSEDEVNSVTTSTGVATYSPSGASTQRIGLYEPVQVSIADGKNNLSARKVWIGDSNASAYVLTTPGFTPTDTWTITYQGYLPAFADSRVADVEAISGQPDRLRVAFQAHVPGTSELTRKVNVYDPALGVRAGDVVEIWTGPTPNDTSYVPPSPRCPDTTTWANNGLPVPPIEGRVVSVDPPDAAHPGGSLVIRQPTDAEAVCTLLNTRTVCDNENRGRWSNKPNCWGSLPTLAPGGVAGSLQVRIRSGGKAATGEEEFVVVGKATGYAGRARAVPGTSVAGPVDPPDFTLSNEGEADLATACGYSTFPLDPLAAPASLAEAEGAPSTVRRACEALAIARRVRRTHLTSVACYRSPSQPTGTVTHCETYYEKFIKPSQRGLEATAPFPSPVGPALAFTLGLQCMPHGDHTPTGCTSGQDTLVTNGLVRDTQVNLLTRGGWVPALRYGGGANGGSGTQPTGGAYFDRTGATQDELSVWNRQYDRYRFFVPYVDNMVLDVSPGQTNGETKVLR